MRDISLGRHQFFEPPEDNPNDLDEEDPEDNTNEIDIDDPNFSSIGQIRRHLRQLQQIGYGQGALLRRPRAEEFRNLDQYGQYVFMNTHNQQQRLRPDERLQANTTALQNPEVRTSVDTIMLQLMQEQADLRTQIQYPAPPARPQPLLTHSRLWPAAASYPQPLLTHGRFLRTAL